MFRFLIEDRSSVATSARDKPGLRKMNRNLPASRIHTFLGLVAIATLALPWHAHIDASAEGFVSASIAGWKVNLARFLVCLIVLGRLISAMETSLGRRAAFFHMVLFSVTILALTFNTQQRMISTIPQWGLWVFVIAGSGFHALSAMRSPREELTR